MRIPAALIVAAVLACAVGAAPAEATQGSVPPEVAEFAVAPDGLLSGLEDFYGPNADGQGIEFDETTEIGAVARVFTFTKEWLAGRETETPVGLANEWAVPVGVGGEPVGVAVIWINPGTVRPQLADFVPDPGFAEALPEVPVDAYLVSDEARAAWFALSPPTLTPLASGSSGVDEEVDLAEYQVRATRVEAPPADEGPSLGSALSVGTIVAVSLVVILVLLVPLARRRKGGAEEAEPEPPVEAEDGDPDGK